MQNLHSFRARWPAQLAAVSALALVAACDAGAPGDANVQDTAIEATDNGDAAAAPSVDEARAFIEEVEKFYREFGEYSARVAWTQATNITYDTDWLVTKVDAEGTEMGVKFANRAKRFNDLELPAEMRRKIEAIKLGLNLPAPERPGAAQELAELNTRMGSTYATGKIELDGEQVARNDLETMMGTVRDPERLQEIWVKWREVPVAENDAGTTMKEDYASMVALANEGARELGFDDVGTMWRARYDLPPAEFAAETDRLWGQVKPLYDELQCHVRAKLNEQYGDDVVPLDQPIRADLLGNMWAQSWSNVYDLVAPGDADPGYDLTELLVANGYDANKMVETGEAFFSSLGFDPLPDTSGSAHRSPSRSIAKSYVTRRPGISTALTMSASKCAPRSTLTISRPCITSLATTTISAPIRISRRFSRPAPMAAFTRRLAIWSRCRSRRIICKPSVFSTKRRTPQKMSGF